MAVSEKQSSLFLYNSTVQYRGNSTETRYPTEHNLKTTSLSLIRHYKPISQMLRRLRQEVHKFKVSLGNLARYCPNINKS